jgi:hypothetical protein
MIVYKTNTRVGYLQQVEQRLPEGLDRYYYNLLCTELKGGIRGYIHCLAFPQLTFDPDSPSFSLFLCRDLPFYPQPVLDRSLQLIYGGDVSLPDGKTVDIMARNSIFRQLVRQYNQKFFPKERRAALREKKYVGNHWVF